MVCIKEDFYTLSHCTLLELIVSYWTEISRNDRKWKFFWRKTDFKNQLVDVLKEKWTSDLPNFDFMIQKFNDQCNDFKPTIFFDNELYLERLVRLAKELKIKNIKRQKWHKNIYAKVKPLRWLLIFFYFL